MMTFEEFVEYKKEEARLNALREEYSKDHNDFFIAIGPDAGDMADAIENALKNGTTYTKEIDKWYAERPGQIF